jgi:outer membrane murein-binding lipoprotein Lpp
VKLHFQPTIVAVVGAIVLASGVCAGCTAAVEAAEPAVEQLAGEADAAVTSIHALTQRVNWTAVEVTPVVESF